MMILCSSSCMTSRRWWLNSCSTSPRLRFLPNGVFPDGAVFLGLGLRNGELVGM